MAHYTLAAAFSHLLFSLPYAQPVTPHPGPLPAVPLIHFFQHVPHIFNRFWYGMTSGAVGRGEGYLVMAATAPFAVYDLDHSHFVCPGARLEYTVVTCLAIQPVGMDFVRKWNIGKTARRFDDKLQIKGRFITFLRIFGIGSHEVL